MDAIKAGAARNSMEAISEPREIVATLLQLAAFVRVQLGDFLERFELTEGRYAVLTVLNGVGAQGLSQSDVAEQLMQSESNVSTLIDRLQRDGLVDRRWSDTDRRKRVLLLTPDGHQLAQRVELSRRQWSESLFAGVSPPERKSLSSALRQLSDIFHDARPRGLAGSTVEVIAIGEPNWPKLARIPECEEDSPQSALERMLSTLGLAGRLAEDER